MVVTIQVQVRKNKNKITRRRAAHGAVLRNHGDECGHALLVVVVFLAEHANESFLFVLNSVLEEAPRDIRKGSSAEGIQQHHLGGYAPIEPTSVTRMTRMLINPGGDQIMFILLLFGDFMSEIVSGSKKSQEANRLTTKSNNNTEPGERPEILQRREEVKLNDKFNNATSDGKGIFFAVINEERIGTERISMINSYPNVLREVEERKEHQVGANARHLGEKC